MSDMLDGYLVLRRLARVDSSTPERVERPSRPPRFGRAQAYSAIVASTHFPGRPQACTAAV